MELRFRIAAFLVMVMLFSLPAFAAQTDTQETDTSSASLEMIAERMKALSGSLSSIPEPPQLNQVIQIPGDFRPEPASEKPVKDNQKETKK